MSVVKTGPYITEFHPLALILLVRNTSQMLLTLGKGIVQGHENPESGISEATLEFHHLGSHSSGFWSHPLFGSVSQFPTLKLRP